MFYKITFQKGDLLQIISKKATGLWIGKSEKTGQIGHFKFINVRLLPSSEGGRGGLDYQQHSHSSSSEQLMASLGPEERESMVCAISGESREKVEPEECSKGRPKSVGELLQRIGLDVSKGKKSGEDKS